MDKKLALSLCFDYISFQQTKKMKEENIADRIQTIEEILCSNYQQIENRSLGTDVNRIPVGFYDYDAITQGLPRGGLIVIGGRPAMGKTSFVLNMGLNVAKSEDLPVCVFSFGMSKENISNCFLSNELEIPSTRLRTSRLQHDEWRLLGEGVFSLSQLPIHISDTPPNSIDEIESICRSIKDESIKKNLGLIVFDFDYIQLLDYLPISDISNRKEYLWRFAKSLKAMAEELNVPVIVTSQLSRDIEGRENKRPRLGDILDFPSLEVYADIITMIYRDEYYDPETEDYGITEIITCKNKNGPIGICKLLFEPMFTRFRNLAPD